MIINKEIPVSAAALIALIFAVPLILYIWVLEPKPPTHDICKNKNSEYRGYYKTRFNIKIQLFHSRNTLQLFLKISRKGKEKNTREEKIKKTCSPLFIIGFFMWLWDVALVSHLRSEHLVVKDGGQPPLGGENLSEQLRDLRDLLLRSIKS